MERVEGTVKKIVFRSDETGFVVMKVDENQDFLESVVVGTCPQINEGEYITAEGKWAKHATFGLQLQAEKIQAHL